MTIGNMDVSFNNYSKETPKIIKKIYRPIMFVSGLWMLSGEPFFTDILNEYVLHQIDKIVGLFSTSIYFICQFFGYTQDNTTSTENT